MLGNDGVDGDGGRWQGGARVTVHEALGVSVVVRVVSALLVSRTSTYRPVNTCSGVKPRRPL